MATGPNAFITQNITPISEMFGRYHVQNKNFNLFVVSTTVASPVTLTTSGSTSQTFGLWNPAGNSLDIVPVRLIMTIQGTGTQAGVVYAGSTGLGTGVAGTSPITAATFLTPVNGNFQGQLTRANTAALATSAATLAAAPTLVRHSPIGWGAPATNTAAIYNNIVDVFDGDIIIAPGTALWVSATAAPGVTANCTLEWIETLH